MLAAEHPECLHSISLRFTLSASQRYLTADVRQKNMTSFTRSNITGSLLLIAGFIIWSVASMIIPHAKDYDYALSYALGGVSFFLAGCFLPEYRKALLLSRKSAIGGMAFLFWLSARGYSQRFFPTTAETSFFTVLLPILIGVIAYWLAIFLIRGIRATPEYDKNEK